MTMEEIKDQLDALTTGEQSEVVVLKDDFMEFLKVWDGHPEKNNIIGKAGLGGNVVYHYKKEENK